MKLRQPKHIIGSKFFNSSQTSTICAMPYEHVGVACVVCRPWVPLGVDEAPVGKCAIVGVQKSSRRSRSRDAVQAPSCAGKRRRLSAMAQAFKRRCLGVVASLLVTPLSALLGIGVEDVVWRHFQSEA